MRRKQVEKLFPAQGCCDTLVGEFCRAFFVLDEAHKHTFFANAKHLLATVDFLRTHKYGVIDEKTCRLLGLVNVVQQVDNFCDTIDDALHKVMQLFAGESYSIVADLKLDATFDYMRDVVTFITLYACKHESNIKGNVLDCGAAFGQAPVASYAKL